MRNKVKPDLSSNAEKGASSSFFPQPENIMLFINSEDD